MQIYMMVGVCIKHEKGICAPEKGFVDINYSSSLPKVIAFLSRNDDIWERTCYEFPSMKQVTQAEVKIS